MFFHEQIDGNVKNYERYAARDIASAYNRGVRALGWFMHTEDTPINRPQFYRMTTWVESQDDKLGYALALTRTEALPDTVEGFALQSVFYTVDREHQVFADDPITLEFRTDDKLGNQLDDIITTHEDDRHELALTVGMLKKMGIATKTAYEDMPEIDMHVGMAVILEGDNLNTLADISPHPGAIPRQGAA